MKTNHKRIAVYAGSFDPVTNGHMNLIERTAPLYDELIVIVAHHPEKKYFFTLEERIEILKSSTKHVENVRIEKCVHEYVIDVASRLGAQVILRGIRNIKDMDDEQTLAEANRSIRPEIETVWLPAMAEFSHMSSSLVKGHINAGSGWQDEIAKLAPEASVSGIIRKFYEQEACK